MIRVFISPAIPSVPVRVRASTRMHTIARICARARTEPVIPRQGGAVVSTLSSDGSLYPPVCGNEGMEHGPASAWLGRAVDFIRDVVASGLGKFVIAMRLRSHACLKILPTVKNGKTVAEEEMGGGLYAGRENKG